MEALEQKNTEGRPDDKPTEVPLLDAPAGPQDDAAPAAPADDSRQAARRTARQSARQAKPKASREPAAELPYAQVVLALELSHLDRAFDYLVPADLDAEAQPGVRVRVRFAGQLVDGFVIARVAESDFAGRFEFLQKVVSPLPVLTPEILELARTVADRYAGTLADVLRLAVPPRHASAEKVPAKATERGPDKVVDGAPWGVYGGGREFIKALQHKTAPKLPRAVWTCLPATDWATALATAMHAVATDAVVLPDPEPAQTQAAQTQAAQAQVTQTQATTPEEAETTEDPEAIADDPAIPDLEPDPTDPALPDPDLPTDYDIDPENLRDLDADRYRDAESEPGAGPAQAAPIAAVAAIAAASSLHGPARIPARGALAIVPDHRDLARLDAALTKIAGPGHHVVLSEELGPAKRYQNWLAVLRGDVKMVIGTRSAMFAPVADLGLVAIWDDGDDLHAEPRAPYPHVREVLLLRAHTTGAAALIGGYTCTAEGAQLVESRWAYPLTAFRSTVRAKSPLIRTSGEEVEKERDPAAAAARLPNLAWRTARAALNDGPVLIQVPRGGYAPSLACIRCRKHARCIHCHGPLELTSGHAMASCLWCGRPAGGWHCDNVINDRPCGGDRFRMLTIGVQRTAEELGRAFANAKVISSAQDTVLSQVSDKPALVVATPGAEPVADGGYAAALLLDGWSLLARRDLRSGEEALRRWLNAAALVRPGGEGGKVVIMAEPGLAPVQALVRWDPVWHARRELADRGELHYPPLARVAELTGTPAAVAEELSLLRLPEMAEVLGPVAVDVPRSDDRASQKSDARSGKKTDPLGRGERADTSKPPIEDRPRQQLHRALVRVPRRLGGDLAAAVREAQGVRSARKSEDWVRVRIDPVQIG
ncbi:primosomal protein N' [Catenulispora pinisilvae]|uniref:primosomal protein N' n=1 Tax=Catenulispora pinisilvae TaxID=2705253 RepID=UPI002B265958|nr:primosomal protein N' [Catenulispora pinisilvae]